MLSKLREKLCVIVQHLNTNEITEFLHFSVPKMVRRSLIIFGKYFFLYILPVTVFIGRDDVIFISRAKVRHA